MINEIKELKGIYSECVVNTADKITDPGKVAKMDHRKKMIKNVIEKLEKEFNQDNGIIKLF